MKTQSNIEAGKTAKTTDSPAVVQERLVRLLPCPFCGSEPHITDESMPDKPLSWFFGRCPNWAECNCWLAGGSPEKVAAKWNRRTSPIPKIRAAVESMIGTTNIPLSAARVRVAAIEEVLEILDGIESSETNVTEHAPLSAGAIVERGVDVETTGEHVNRAADRGCCVSTCSLLDLLFHAEPLSAEGRLVRDGRVMLLRIVGAWRCLSEDPPNLLLARQILLMAEQHAGLFLPGSPVPDRLEEYLQAARCETDAQAETLERLIQASILVRSTSGKADTAADHSTEG